MWLKHCSWNLKSGDVFYAIKTWKLTVPECTLLLGRIGLSGPLLCQIVFCIRGDRAKVVVMWCHRSCSRYSRVKFLSRRPPTESSSHVNHLPLSAPHTWNSNCCTFNHNTLYLLVKYRPGKPDCVKLNPIRFSESKLQHRICEVLTCDFFFTISS